VSEPEVRAAPAARDGLPALGRLLAEAFPRAPRLDLAWLAWSYLENPLGPSLSARAHADGRVVAHLGGRRLVASVGAHAAPRPGILVHHAATAPAYRGRGLLVRAIEALLARAAEDGAAFAVAVLNANSFHGFVRRAGFSPLGPLAVRVGVGEPPPRSAQPGLEFEPARDAAWLAWRLAPPGAPYRARVRAGAVELWRPSAAVGIPVLLGTAPEGSASALPRFAPRTPLRAFVGLDPARRFGGRAYLDVPRRLRPSPLELVFRPLAPGLPPPPRAGVRFEALDFDAW
jgi:GNAT superfamily N-acetyltransferase